MKRASSLFFLLLLSALPLHAFEPLPPKPTPLKKETLSEISDNIGSVKLEVLMNQEVVSWPMTQTEISVLMGKLKSLSQSPHPSDALFAKLPEPNPDYRGIKLALILRDGEKIAPMHIFEGNILADGNLFSRDAGRELEYWLFGTAKVVKQQMLAAQVLPVFTFHQCKTLGNVIVNTQPRQCLLPDNNLIFDIPEKPTLAGLKVSNFDECLEHGAALIHTFPRRCMVKGGRVFTEPPRLLDGPRSLNLMTPVGNVSKSISATKPSETTGSDAVTF